MASKAAMEPGKNLSINKPMEEGKQNSPYSNKDQKFKDNEEKKLNAGNNNNQGQETKFNSAALVSPQSTKSSLTDSNSNQSSMNSQSNSNNNTPQQQHQNINRSFIKNSKLTTQSNNNSRYNYSNNNQQKTSSRPEQKDKQTKAIPFDNELVLQNLIRAQIEYLFSDYHLTNDTYLLARMQDNQQHWLSIDELCHNQKIRCLTIKKDRILRALKESKYLQLSSDEERVRRPDFTLPKLKPNRDLRRTVFLYGIPYNKTEQDIRKILSLHGHIKRIHFQPDNDIDGDDSNIDDEAPNKQVAQLIMKKKFLFPSRYSHSDHDTDNESNRGGFRNDGNITPKSLDGNQSDTSSKRDRMMNDLYAHPVRNPNGDSQDFSHLKTCFVVFESQSQATKCVKARVRAVDGMRCIHKYDYNKVAKKFRTAQMKGEKLSFSPPPPNYQSPRISSQGERGYNHHNRGKSPGAQSDRYGNNQYGNNRRYNRSFGPNSRDNNYNDNRRDNRGYQSYRDRSHSQSSQGSNHGDRGDRNNNRYDNNNNDRYNNNSRGRYYQRNNNNNNNQNRSQTPNYQKSSNYGNNNPGGGGFFGRNNKRDSGDDKDNNQGSMRQSGHRLGRRADRNSHDNSNDKPNDVRSYHDNRRKYGNNNNNNQSQPGYNNNNNNRGNNNRHGASTSPHRTSQHSAAHSVGNQSNTSDQSNMNKPIFHSMNKQNNNNTNDGNNNNNAPQQDVRKVQNNNQQTQQQQQNVANQPTYARKKQPVRAATPNMKSNGSIVSPPQLHSFVGNEISPSPDLKKPQNANNNQQQQQQQAQPGTSKPVQMIRSVSANTAPTSSNNQQSGQQRASTPQSSQQSRSTAAAAPQLYHPIGTNALPTRQDAQALQAAGYNHELYYLPIDDPNIVGIMDDIYQDPLVAYDVYFGVDQSGQSTSTQAAAQQLQQQQQRVHQQQQQRQQQQQSQQQQQAPPQQQVQQRHSQPQHTAYSSHYNVQQNVQNVQQQQPQNYGNYQQQYSQTPTHHQQQQYHQSYNMNQGPPQTNLQHSSSLQHNSYSAHSQYQQQSNGPRSAPYGPVNKQSQTQLAGNQYRAEQWQLDKLEQFKQQKQQQIIAQKQAQQQQQQQAQQQGGKTTALSVLSSSN